MCLGGSIDVTLDVSDADHVRWVVIAKPQHARPANAGFLVHAHTKLEDVAGSTNRHPLTKEDLEWIKARETEFAVVRGLRTEEHKGDVDAEEEKERHQEFQKRAEAFLTRRLKKKMEDGLNPQGRNISTPSQPPPMCLMSYCISPLALFLV